MTSRSPLVRLTLALLGIGAVGVVAASLRETTAPGGGGTAETGPVIAPAAEQAVTVPDLWSELLVLFVLIVALSAVWLAAVHPNDIVRWVGVSICVLLFACVVAVTMYAVPMTDISDRNVTEEGSSVEFNDSESSDDGDGQQEDDPLLSVSLGPAIVGLGWLFAMLAGAVLLNARRTTTDSAASLNRADPEEPESPSDDISPTAIGAVAATAAAEIETAEDVDNEVYRAWASMAALLDVEAPETSTPGEFETAAIEAGMDPEQVRRLTELFESVRYGAAETTPERAQRAQETFERIADTDAPDRTEPDRTDRGANQ